jgi:hypothetical protein
MSKQKKPRERKTPSRSVVKVPPMEGQDDTHLAQDIPLEQTVSDIERTGVLPDAMTLEQRFPGINRSAIAKKEVYMAVIYNLRIRGYKIHQIARQFKLSERQVVYYIQEIEKQFEREAINISFAHVIGKSMALYQELQVQAHKILYEKTTDNENKLAAINSSMRLENAQVGLLEKAGFFKNTVLSPLLNSSQPRNQMQAMQQLLLQALRGEADDADILDAEFVTDENNFVAKEEHVKLLRL